MVKNVRFGSCLVGEGQPCFVNAEAGVSHNGDIATADRRVYEAVRAGANAAKFQAFITEELITADAPKANYNYQLETTGQTGSQSGMLKALELARLLS